MRFRIVGVAVCVALVGCNRNVAPPRMVLAEYEGPVRSRDVLLGLQIYQTVCAVCHAGRVNPEGYHWSPGQMRQQIRAGNRLMPPLGHELLTDEQVEAVLAYLVGTYAVEGELPPLDADDIARERAIAERRATDEHRMRGQLERELDPELLEEARASDTSTTSPSVSATAPNATAPNAMRSTPSTTPSTPSTTPSTPAAPSTPSTTPSTPSAPSTPSTTPTTPSIPSTTPSTPSAPSTPNAPSTPTTPSPTPPRGAPDRGDHLARPR